MGYNRLVKAPDVTTLVTAEMQGVTDSKSVTVETGDTSMGGGWWVRGIEHPDLNLLKEVRLFNGYTRQHFKIKLIPDENHHDFIKVESADTIFTHVQDGLNNLTYIAFYQDATDTFRWVPLNPDYELISEGPCSYVRYMQGDHHYMVAVKLFAEGVVMRDHFRRVSGEELDTPTYLDTKQGVEELHPGQLSLIVGD